VEERRWKGGGGGEKVRERRWRRVGGEEEVFIILRVSLKLLNQKACRDIKDERVCDIWPG
jgi:hypothetical protein